MIGLVQRVKPLLWTGLGALLLGPWGCGSSGLVGGECALGYAYCEGACVELASNASHCGACGQACASDEVCLSGVCEASAEGGAAGETGAGGTAGSGGSGGSGGAISGGTGGSGGASSGGSGGALGSGGAGVGGTSSGGAGGSGGSGGTAGSGGSGGSGGVGGSGGSGGLCEVPPYETSCGGSCVDTSTDANHCGACFKQCVSGICENGVCVGETPGHMVAVCMDYSLHQANSMQTRLLGNAIFLTNQTPVRILAYTEYASAAGVTTTNSTIQSAAQSRGRSYQITEEDDGSLVASALNRDDYDVLLVYDQVNAPSGALATLGASWAVPARSFAEAGGVVLVLAGGSGTNQMHAFITQLGILATSGVTDRSGEIFFVQQASDALAANLTNQFRGLSRSCTFVTHEVPSGARTFVITDTNPSAGVGAPSVVHGVVQP